MKKILSIFLGILFLFITKGAVWLVSPKLSLGILLSVIEFSFHGSAFSTTGRLTTASVAGLTGSTFCRFFDRWLAFGMGLARFFCSGAISNVRKMCKYSSNTSAFCTTCSGLKHPTRLFPQGRDLACFSLALVKIYYSLVLSQPSPQVYHYRSQVILK